MGERVQHLPAASGDRHGDLGGAVQHRPGPGMMTTMSAHEPICPSCGTGIDPSGPAIASRPQPGSPAGKWTATWVPFVEDLRGTPTRLVHAECFVNENGLPELIAVLHQRDKIQREQENQRWRRTQQNKPR